MNSFIECPCRVKEIPALKSDDSDDENENAQSFFSTEEAAAVFGKLGEDFVAKHQNSILYIVSCK